MKFKLVGHYQIVLKLLVDSGKVIHVLPYY